MASGLGRLSSAVALDQLGPETGELAADLVGVLHLEQPTPADQVLGDHQRSRSGDAYPGAAVGSGVQLRAVPAELPAQREHETVLVPATVTDLEAWRPPDFDLSDAWRQVVATVEEQRSLASATVRVDDRFVFALRGQFGRHCAVLDPGADGRARVRVAAPTALMIAQHLAGWGGLLEVEDSDEVSGELARLGTELVQRYGS